MRVEIHLNGRLVLELMPETDLERMVLAEMASGAGRGKVVTLAHAGEVEAVQVAVEK